MKKIYTDGSFARNRHGYGIVIVEDGVVLLQEGGEVPEKWCLSNNIGGECYAVLHGLDLFRAHFPSETSVTIVHDYEGVADWAEGRWRAKTLVAQMYLRGITKAKQVYSVTFEWTRGHTNNPFNELADRLAGGYA